jgi:hypothetical protein
MAQRLAALARLAMAERRKSRSSKSSTAQSKAPRLLSGGNPQIEKGDGDAVVAAYLDAMPGWKQDVGNALDRIVVANVPALRKAVRWNTPFYGSSSGGWFVAFHCLTAYVKVAFLRGAELTPQPPVASKQAEVRYVHIHEGDAIDEAQLAPWVRQAAKLRGVDVF